MRLSTGVFTKVILASLAVGIVVTTSVLVATPKRYRSEAFFHAAPANPFTAHVVDGLKRNVFFSRESLGSLILERNLYPRERSRMPMDAVVEEMKRNIRVRSSTVSSGSKGRHCGPDIPPDQTCDAIKFVVEFEYSDPKIAQEVNEKLVWLFYDGDFAIVAPEPNGGATFGNYDPPTLPLKPAEPSLARSSAIGLLSGLLTALALTVLAKSHRTPTFANS